MRRKKLAVFLLASSVFLGLPAVAHAETADTGNTAIEQKELGDQVDSESEDGATESNTSVQSADEKEIADIAGDSKEYTEQNGDSEQDKTADTASDSKGDADQKGTTDTASDSKESTDQEETKDTASDSKEDAEQKTAGFVTDAKGKKYYYSNGTYATGEFRVDDKNYLANDEGYIFTQKGWLKYTYKYGHEATYYVEDDGSLHKGWLEEDGHTYYLEPELSTGVFYAYDTAAGIEEYLADKEGHVYTAKGWVEDTDQYGMTARYYLNEDHTLYRGWLDLNGSRYYLDPKLYTGVFTAYDKEAGENKKYLADKDGRLYTQAGWIDDTDKNGIKERYYLNKDGSLYSGWLELDGSRYYLSPELQIDDFWIQTPGTQDGKYYLADQDGRIITQKGWVDHTNRNGYKARYYINDDGSLYSGWLESDGKKYCLDPELEKGVFPALDADGNLKKYLADKDGQVYTSKGWVDDTDQYGRTSRYYLNDDGSLYEGCMELDGYKYYLNPGLQIGVFSAYDEETKKTKLYLSDKDGHVYSKKGWGEDTDQNGYTYKYYFNDDSSLYEGWLEEGGNKYYLSPQLETGFFRVYNYTDSTYKDYLADKDGHVYTQKGWVQYTEGPGYNTSCYLNDDSSVYTGWLEENGHKYYLKPELQAGVFEVYGETAKEDKWYLADKDGQVYTQKGWVEDTNRYGTAAKYYIKEDGTLLYRD
jgi:glucan-binding YG repeat protein